MLAQTDLDPMPSSACEFKALACHPGLDLLQSIFSALENVIAFIFFVLFCFKSQICLYVLQKFLTKIVTKKF